MKDIDPGIFSSTPTALTVAGNRLYFVACDAAAGCEPWVFGVRPPAPIASPTSTPAGSSSPPPVFQGYQDPETANLAAWFFSSSPPTTARGT